MLQKNQDFSGLNGSDEKVEDSFKSQTAEAFSKIWFFLLEN